MATMSATYITRHGAMRFLGEYEAGGDALYQRGQSVVVRSERGQEVGEVLCEANPRALALIAEPTKGQIVRVMTEADHAEADRVRQNEAKEFERCGEFVRQRRLQMELVDVEHLFGGERIIFYFL